MVMKVAVYNGFPFHYETIGYQIFSIRTSRDKHSESFPFRHGLTVCQLHKQ